MQIRASKERSVEHPKSNKDFTNSVENTLPKCLITLLQTQSQENDA
jgi:hypothetical protein